MSVDKFSPPPRYARFGSNIWNEFVKLAVEHKPLNLGLGCPDFGPPEHLTKALAEVALSDNILFHQYTRGFGHPRLVHILSKLYSKLTDREINPFTDILITIGADEALYTCIQGHTKPGDEVIIVEPFFDSYEPMVVSGGGVPVFIPLRLKPKSDGPLTSGDFTLDPNELASKFNNRTKAIIINTPHNPLGKVFSLDELTMIADLCKKWNVLCIADEVYEWLVYKPFKHVRIATLPGMWERTITVGSAGKIFSATGWKLGWAYGPANLMYNLQIVHQNCLYTCPTPLQEAVARGFELEMSRLSSPDCYFNAFQKELEQKRDFMTKILTDIGMKPVIPQGGYFVITDWSGLESQVDLSEETDKQKDFRFAKWLTKNVKLQGIPPSAFYSVANKHLGENHIRFCFIKKNENLQRAAKILKDWKEKSEKL